MLAAVLLLVALPVVVLGVRLVLHGADPSSYGPAGTPSLFAFLTDVLAELGFIMAVAIGASAGTTDLTDGVFRHLVITGRSRVALYLARVPAGLAVLVPLVALGFIVLCLVTGLAGISGEPAVNTMVKAGLWLELDVMIGFVVGLGFAALVGQRTLPVVALIALQIIITPILAGHAIPYLLNAQRLVVGVAMDQLRPTALAAGGNAPHVVGGGGSLQIPPMPTWAMITVIVGWIVAWTVIGASRMATRDA